MNEESTVPQTEILVPATIAVGELAKRFDMGPAKLVGILMKNGVMATINESVDFDTATIIGEELGFSLKLEQQQDVRPSDGEVNTVELSDLQDRPPVVAMLGHVDHGKTSLLDAIRDTLVVDSESGGITQHIGAYQVTRSDRIMTFLDTPGHEAFSAIRAHGVKVTDVVVIVIAADDGVKPQTEEAVRLAKDAGAGIVVAINKVDKPDADINRVKQQLSEIDMIPDDWGGTVPCVEVSAKTKTGLDALLDMILLVADINKPQAHFIGNPRGIIIESHMETGKGAVVTALIQEGSLSSGMVIVAGSAYAKVRSLEDYLGQGLKQATPGTPVLITGFKTVPTYGDWFEGMANEKEAKEWLTQRSRDSSMKSLGRTKTVSAQDIDKAVNKYNMKDIPVLIKADTQGSVESIVQALEHLGNDEVQVKVVSTGIGDISENDINTAVATGALVLGFHVAVPPAVNQLAKRSGVTHHVYKIIYELLDDARAWLTSLLEPELVETDLGTLEILAIFKVSKDGVICGGKVTQGSVEPGTMVQIMRDKEVIGETEVLQLNKGSEKVEVALFEEECGLLLKKTVIPAVGDVLKFVKHESVTRTL
ncbi:MAG: translation initiation factor IF-2 [bacterium]